MKPPGRGAAPEAPRRDPASGKRQPPVFVVVAAGAVAVVAGVVVAADAAGTVP